ncbi:PP2C family protein-serine/threonine phosphatase [Microcoleus vaginatus]|uniref:PP2C family protein-serine/threonine phosphatase n=1 Tax=Microcoleus vaginatus TaxID=119532 RepID=UPI004040A95D
MALAIDLQPGDGIVLYSDGITEAKNMDLAQYGLERLCAIVSQNWQQSAEEIKQPVIADVRKFIDEKNQFYAICLLILK